MACGPGDGLTGDDPGLVTVHRGEPTALEADHLDHVGRVVLIDGCKGCEAEHGDDQVLRVDENPGVDPDDPRPRQRSPGVSRYRSHLRFRHARNCSQPPLGEASPLVQTISDMAKTKQRNNQAKWVYLFTEGSREMRDLLGGKGAVVAEMTRAGMPVPPGFTITTETCRQYYADGKKFPESLWEQVVAALKDVEKQTGKGFGDPKNPLLVSVRSGAKFSMPGMMDTVLNLGLNQDTLNGLTRLTGDERFALDSYRRFVQMYGKIVKGIDGEIFEDRFDHQVAAGEVGDLGRHGEERRRA